MSGGVEARAAAPAWPSEGAAASGWSVSRALGRRLVRRDRYSVESLGFRVTRPESRARVERVLDAFFAGADAMLDAPGPAAVLRTCLALPEWERPFAVEGAAMAAGAVTLLRPAAGRRLVEEGIVGGRPEYFVMPYVGLGVWCGFRHGPKPERALREARSLAVPRYGDLLLDGWGFQLGFFRYLGAPEVTGALEAVGGEGRLAAYQGFGRALWFLGFDDREWALDRARELPGDGGRWALVGLGLAAAFTHPDRWEEAYAFADAAPVAERPWIEKGIRLALEVRRSQEPAYVESCLARLPSDLAARAREGLARSGEALAAARDRDRFYREFAERA